MTNLILLTLIIGELRRMSPELLKIIAIAVAIFLLVGFAIASGSIFALIGLFLIAGVAVTGYFLRD